MNYENDILLFKRLSHWCKDNIICEIPITCINIIYVDDSFNKKYNTCWFKDVIIIIIIIIIIIVIIRGINIKILHNLL